MADDTEMPLPLSHLFFIPIFKKKRKNEKKRIRNPSQKVLRCCHKNKLIKPSLFRRKKLPFLREEGPSINPFVPQTPSRRKRKRKKKQRNRGKRNGKNGRLQRPLPVSFITPQSPLCALSHLGHLPEKISSQLS
ncbi:hypothetical protein CEXT_436731 [Caerostris extrusa]|uniref:Uncharacterized protein n=1 Tax=Caerostris extrusa TaxID=172846 RepID=A0AAV4TEG4_CAEEX|nr:hypothetical protein CEXT_436731 [Caerostris extrusa]